MWNPIAFLTLLGSVAFAERMAIVYLSDPSGDYNVTGNVTFIQTANGISVVGTVIELKPGKHGFHIHLYGKAYPDCLASGPHFNPENYTHGAPNDTVRHVGDLGNIVALNDGIATVDMVDTIIALEGNHNIIGRTLVVHEGEDDLGRGGNETSLTTGNAGGRVACGVIGILDDGPSSSTTFTTNILVNIAVLIATYGLRSIFSL